MLQTGDKVRFLNSTGGGTVVRLDGRMAYVEDNDGFEIPVLAAECVVVQKAGDARGIAAKQQQALADTVAVAADPKKHARETRQAANPVFGGTPGTKVAPQPAPLDLSETPGGDKLNIVLGYEPLDIKQISTTTFDTFLVNDSNYYLYFAYLTAPPDALDDTGRWQTRYAGIIEPNTQVWLGEVQRAELASLERICVQYVAFKRDKLFELKQPATVTARLDVTKFCRLHCFRPNEYFDRPVIAVPVTVDDKQQGDQPDPSVLAETLASVVDEAAMRAKIRTDRRKTTSVKKRPVPLHRDVPAPGQDGIIEVDLHIDALLDTTAGLSPADMLNHQVDHFRKVMDACLSRHGQKIVFIHGKGEGVLRQALLRELNHRYKGHPFQDASFRQYGYGATQVTIR